MVCEVVAIIHGLRFRPSGLGSHGAVCGVVWQLSDIGFWWDSISDQRIGMGLSSDLQGDVFVVSVSPNGVGLRRGGVWCCLAAE